MDDAQAKDFDGKQENVYVTCCDFNSIQLLGHCSKKNNKFSVSAKVPCYDELVAAGLDDYLKGIYGDLLLAEPNSPYGKGAKWNVTAQIDVNNPTGESLEDHCLRALVRGASHPHNVLVLPQRVDRARSKLSPVVVLPLSPSLAAPAEELIEKLSNIGRHIFAAPFHRALTALVEGTTADCPPLNLAYRPTEQVFVIASPHVVQVIFSLAFVDQVDRELARVFTVEFAESGRVVEKAPGVNFYPPGTCAVATLHSRQISSRHPHLPRSYACASGRKPDELNGIDHTIDDNCIGYLVFAVSKMHVDKPAKMERVIDLLVQFRSYLLYHIKCTKTELHSMMRKTYANLIQVKERCTPKGKTVHIK